MGIFSKSKQPEKQNSRVRRPYSSSPFTTESTVSSNELARPERATQELSGSSKALRNESNDTAPAAKPNNILELEIARQRAHIRELTTNEQKLKQAVAFYAHLGIPSDFSDMSASNASMVSLALPPSQQRKDSGVTDVSPSMVDTLAHAPEVVSEGMDSEFKTSPNASGPLTHASTYESAGTWGHEPPTVPIHYATRQQHQRQQQQQRQQQSPSSPLQPLAFDVAKAIVSVPTLPWSKAFAMLAERSSNSGLLLLMFGLFCLTYSIIMTYFKYLFVAIVLGIVAHYGSKLYFIAKHTELQGEYIRSIASNFQTVEIVPPDMNAPRFLLPEGMNRVDELN